MDAVHFPAAVAFGRTLVESGDLDPVYIAVAGAKLSLAQRKRFVLAYACLYNVPLAGAMSEQAGDAFWNTLTAAAASSDYPRGSERRHWRGAASIASAAHLRATGGSPENVVDMWFGHYGAGRRFADVVKRVSPFVGFGPWVTFKIADLGERVLEYPVNFDDCALGVYRDPAQGANLVLYGDHSTTADLQDTDAALRALIASPLGKLVPRPGTRRFNVQEAETVLCKYKSHVKGSYPIGKDSKEYLQALRLSRFPSKTGTKLYNALNNGINWSLLP